MPAQNLLSPIPHLDGPCRTAGSRTTVVSCSSCRSLPSGTTGVVSSGEEDGDVAFFKETEETESLGSGSFFLLFYICCFTDTNTAVAVAFPPCESFLPAVSSWLDRLKVVARQLHTAGQYLSSVEITAAWFLQVPVFLVYEETLDLRPGTQHLPAAV